MFRIGEKVVYKTTGRFSNRICISPEENEAIVHMILWNYPEMKLEEIRLDYKYARKWINKINDKVYRKEVEKTIRILPSVESEWFFIAKFKKIKI